MVDHVSVAKRSRIMASVSSKNSGPERKVRSALFKKGFRFRIHRRDLPGTPDIVLPKHHLAVFVHGCFWHGHECSKGQLPKSNSDFWTAKIARNRDRDRASTQALIRAGWDVEVLWTCDLDSGIARLIGALQRLSAAG